MSFRDLVETLERISAPFVKSAEKTKIFITYLHKFPRATTAFYDIYRLLIPALDRQRGTYGLRETALGKLYSEAFSLPLIEAKRLRYYRDPTKAQISSATAVRVGDFPALLQSILEQRIFVAAAIPPSIEFVNDFLDKLASIQDLNAKVDHLRSNQDVFSANEHKWLCRIILKDLKISMGHERLLSYLDKSLVGAYNASGDMKDCILKVEEEFRKRNADWTDKLDLTGGQPFDVEIFKPIRPMLARRINSDQVKSKLFNLPKIYHLEPKLDGERLLCHYSKPPPPGKLQIIFFTRAGNSEYANAYIEHFSKLLEDNLKFTRTDEVILDGELLVWDELGETVLPFGAARGAATGALYNAHLFYVVFDVLRVKTSEVFDLTNQPFSKRREILKKVLPTQVPHYLEIIHSELIHSPDKVTESLARVVENREEGLILKDSSSKYVAGSRDGGWFKVKPDYGWLADTLDLLVIGVYLSDGIRRRDLVSGTLQCKFVGQNSSEAVDHVSTFLLGTLDRDQGLVHSFSKVGTGYKIDELREIIEAIRQYVVPFTQPPSWWAPWESIQAKVRPDFIIPEVENTFIMEVMGAEIVPSDTFSLGLTLRFPRCVRGKYMRADKTWMDAETSDMVRDFASGKVKRKNAKVQAESDEDSHESPQKGKKKKAPLPSFRARPDMYMESRPGTIEQTSAIFSGQEIYVLPFAGTTHANKLKTKAEAEELILAGGGTTVQTYQPGKTDLVIADKVTVRSKNIFNVYGIDILNPQYLLDCQNSVKLLDPTPAHVLHSCSNTAEKWLGKLDKYGDDYTREFQSIDELARLLYDVPVECIGIDDEIESQLPEALTLGVFVFDREYKRLMNSQIEEEVASIHGKWIAWNKCTVTEENPFLSPEMNEVILEWSRSRSDQHSLFGLEVGHHLLNGWKLCDTGFIKKALVISIREPPPANLADVEKWAESIQLVELAELSD